MREVAPGRDYYQVLGITPAATRADIKRAYRALALHVHPDRNLGDRLAEERMKEIGEAYAVLSAPDRRAAYDRAIAKSVPPPGMAAGGFSGSVASAVASVRDLIGRRRLGRDLRYTLEVTFEEAALGVSRTIRFPTHRACSRCGGTGARPRSARKRCGECGGRGEVRVQEGAFTRARSCGSCHGSGLVAASACTDCGGGGLLGVEREYSVKLPPGTEDGSTRCVPGEGEPGRGGGAPGDLHLVVRVQPHPRLTRDGNDVGCDAVVTFSQAALGAVIEVPTLEGTIRLRVPAGTQSGRVFRLTGRGIPRGRGSGSGDLLVRVAVETPTRLTARQRELLVELGRAGDEEAVRPARARSGRRG